MAVVVLLIHLVHTAADVLATAIAETQKPIGQTLHASIVRAFAGDVEEVGQGVQIAPLP